MSDSRSIPVQVRILDREYRVACQPGEEEALLASARFLDQKMREIKSSGKVIGNDRIAVMVALNLAHELLEQRSKHDDGEERVERRIQALREKVEVALHQTNQLEL